MSFSGDNIVIKDNYSFERIENLKIGDSLIGPEGEVIITKIEQKYEKNNYVLKTNNFYPFYLGEDTFVLTSKEIQLYNRKSEKYENYITSSEFIKISDIFPTNLLCLKNLELEKNKEFENPWLYGLVLAKGDLIIKKDGTNNLIIKNIQKYSKKIKDSDNSLNINKNNKLTYINDIAYEWITNMKVKSSQKKIYPTLFYSKEEYLKEFLKSFIEQNSIAYLNHKEFRCYVESKILSIQLFYLIANLYKELPFIEKINKDRVEYKKIAQADKKKKYSITMVSDLTSKTKKSNELFYQEIDKINYINKEIRMYNIETLDNKPFYLNNIIVKG